MEREEMKWQAFVVGENTLLLRELYVDYQAAETKYKETYVHTYVYLILRVAVHVKLS